jgi:hypothetical protein
MFVIAHLARKSSLAVLLDLVQQKLAQPRWANYLLIIGSLVFMYLLFLIILCSESWIPSLHAKENCSFVTI